MNSGQDNEARIVTPLTQLLDIRHPVVLAPMDGTANGRLAAAVARAGGLGLIGGGYADADWLEGELEAAAGARVGVGFITFALDERPAALRLALEAKPIAVQLSFGDPRPHAEAIRAAGAALICQVQTPDEVKAAVEAGADVLVAQGRDAGGHGRPDLGTMALVPSMVDSVAPVPVVAAGGIADGRGLAAALMLGAAGVTMGTRFLASTEASSNPAEQAGLVAARSVDTVRTDVFDQARGPAWPEGHDGRVVRSSFTEEWRRSRDEAAASERYWASAPDDYDVRPLWAGEGLDLISAIETPDDIVRSVVDQAIARLRTAGPMVVAGAGR
ncbi:MAG: nitronate monooxygenase [Acidimicrobiales bacterium]|nr:nitronate monooxygenase [Acidimicrobiales bacterium]